MQEEAPGVSGSILEGLDEMLTVNRLRLPPEPRRSLACTNAIENIAGHNPPRHTKREALARWLCDGRLPARRAPTSPS
jgi:putative transposase